MMDERRPPAIDDLIARAMDDLGLEGEIERLPEEDQYRVIGKMLDYNLDILKKLNADIDSYIEESRLENAAYNCIQNARKEGRYIGTYEETVQ